MLSGLCDWPFWVLDNVEEVGVAAEQERLLFCCRCHCGPSWKLARRIPGFDWRGFGAHLKQRELFVLHFNF